MFEHWPKYYRNNLISVNEDGFIGIITGWSKRDFIKERIDECCLGKICVIGQLYSAEGINYVIRNTFLNPKLCHIIVVGLDLTNSIQAFRGFLNGDELKVMQPEIPMSYITEFQNYFINHTSFCKIEELNDIIKSVPSPSSPWIEKPISFLEERIPEASHFPSERAGFRISGQSIPEIWLKALDRVMKFGIVKPTQYGGNQREIVSLVSVIGGVLHDEELPEFLPFTKEDLDRYYPQILTSQKPEEIAYTYGSRLHSHNGINQIDAMVAELKKDSFSRRAYATTWDVQIDTFSEKQPCIVSVQCLIQNSTLYMTTYIRSNDIYAAWPINAFGLKKLQSSIAEKLEITIGDLVMISNSAHIYDKDIIKAESVIKHFKPKLECSEDPRGNFLIQVDDELKKIVVTHITTDGNKLNKFTAQTAREICNQIYPYISDTLHSLYLGRELMRAQIALERGVGYVQDADD